MQEQGRSVSCRQTAFDYIKIILHSKVTFWTRDIIKDVSVDMPCIYNYSRFCFIQYSHLSKSRLKGVYCIQYKLTSLSKILSYPVQV